LKPITKLLHREKILIIVDIVIVLLVTSFIGQFFVSRILKPVKEMAITADKITRKSLSARVESTHLDYEMQHLVDSINSMINRLEKAFKHIANFSLDVSHELKTPLAIMRSESEFALIKERSHKEYQSVLQSNLDQIQRMKKLVDDLLLLAKVDHEIEVFTFEKLELCGFLKKLYEKEKMLAAEKKINIEFETSIDTVFVSADTLHLRRLFINLLANAIKFTPLGGKIGITVKQTAEIAYIAISDTGIGINQEELDRIFERFYRTEEADETAEPGSGLGLCLALSIVKVHNGKIDVESTVGKGSTFTIALPTMVL
ncbi:HAMP domain-containing protein, partial [bacterium]|nr:HAMP domain-containing protein [bacterium]